MADTPIRVALVDDQALFRAGIRMLVDSQPDLEVVAEEVQRLDANHDVVLVEGAGGLLVGLDAAGRTLADLALLLAPAPVLVVAAAGLGTLNTAALTAEALAARSLPLLGVVIGSWPDDPGLAEESNLVDLPRVTGAPLWGRIPAGAGVESATRAAKTVSSSGKCVKPWRTRPGSRFHRASRGASNRAPATS